jgi:hypothetical protein
MYKDGNVQNLGILVANVEKLEALIGTKAPLTVSTLRIKKRLGSGVSPLILDEATEIVKNVIFAQGEVNPEMRSDSTYSVFIVFANDGSHMMHACCSCPCGGFFRGACKHIGAMCCLLQYLEPLGASAVLKRDSCTGRPCGWINPKGLSMPSAMIDDVDNTTKKKLKCSPNPRMKTVTVEMICAFGDKLDSAFQLSTPGRLDGFSTLASKYPLVLVMPKPRRQLQLGDTTEMTLEQQFSRPIVPCKITITAADVMMDLDGKPR